MLHRAICVWLPLKQKRIKVVLRKMNYSVTVFRLTSIHRQRCLSRAPTILDRGAKVSISATNLWERDCYQMVSLPLFFRARIEVMKRSCTRILLVLVIGIVAFMVYWFIAPPTQLEARIFFRRWQSATEAGDWDAVWSLMGPPSSGIEPSTWHPNYSEEKSSFIRERQASRPGVLRRVRADGQLVRRMTHVDDPYTFLVTVHIDYIDPQLNTVTSGKPLQFYITKEAGRLGIWGFDAPDW
jgi:hypothetical protein